MNAGQTVRPAANKIQAAAGRPGPAASSTCNASQVGHGLLGNRLTELAAQRKVKREFWPAVGGPGLREHSGQQQQAVIRAGPAKPGPLTFFQCISALGLQLYWLVRPRADLLMNSKNERSQEQLKV